MKQRSSEHLNIAWFKLEEFIAKGEKERALTVFRLLSHSIADVAVRLQLEGDILHAFHDPKALNLYQKAAELHEQSQEPVKAAMMYEFIATLTTASLMHTKPMNCTQADVL